MHQKTTLDNGLRIITDHMPHTRSASICIFIRAGSRYESDALGGISHFVEHMLFRGTEKRRSSRDISTEIEGVGGTLNAATDRETTVYWCKVPQPHFQRGMDVLCDMLLASRIDSGDMEKERAVIIEEINMSYDAPSSRVGLLIDALMWGGHPLGRDIAGTKRSVGSLTRTALMSYVTQRYRPAGTVVSIAGNVTHEEAVAAVKKRLGRWTAHGQAKAFLPYTPKPRRRLRVERRDIEQAHLCLSVPGVSAFDPRRYALDITNVILGEGMSCRLFTRVRDELGLAYSISSYAEHLSDTGALTVYAGVDTSKLVLAVEAIAEEFARLRDETVSAVELTKAKELAKGRLLLRLEDSRSVAGWHGAQEIIKGEILTVDEVVAEIEAVTADNLRHLAAEFVRPEHFHLAVVGPVKEVAKLRGILEE
ncbi:MAG: insulinase family protein [Dehalococcoidia bacterium]|nr:insulinase family protein [Dehalococcoidia bacterium]